MGDLCKGADDWIVVFFQAYQYMMRYLLEEWSSKEAVVGYLFKGADDWIVVFFQAYQYMMRYLLEEWSSMEAELMRPRGLWGPPMGHELDKWQLDMTEGKKKQRIY